ncbi:hypothetical protein LVD15_02860 [Fulvivirga maritima]|uniref:hypothetical protein n=1 Tax=Fulvivirga maritima TaxID=2904247 RepID=UPI001F372AA5|nr:hypothetical protein [Fulvivirga maritima]UII27388.1 hypothetical protein LVD15_02860 [Fulvivirga maritima]
MKYEKLFSVNYFHEYYSSGKFRGVRQVLDGNTKSLLKSYGIVLRDFDSGFSLLYRESENGSSLLKNIKSPLRFCFFLIAKDTSFYNYSDISTALNEPYWLTNLGAEEQQLHKGDYLAGGEQVVLVSSVLDIKNHLNAVGSDSDISIKNLYGEVFHQRGWASIDQAEFNLFLKESGYLKISTQDQNYSFYYKPSGLKQCMAVLNIVIEPGSGGKHHFDTIKGTDYTINIASRATTWKYNLIHRDDGKYAEFKVYSGKNEVPLNDVQDKIMVTGEKAYYIETTAPIQLQERYERHMELEMVKIEAGRNVKKRMNLPTPDVNKVRMQAEQGEIRAYSEMYIYF